MRQKNQPMKKIFSIILFIFPGNVMLAQKTDMEYIFKNPPASAKPWVFWYWMHGAFSKEGITADLEAMNEAGIGGAYLMPIQDTLSTIPFTATVRQLTPEWWNMVKFAMQEAKRLDLQLAMHVSDGFALAGGPWITAELSMQKLVWTKTYIKGGSKEKISLDRPEAVKDYYKDIAVFAYPANAQDAFSGTVQIPTVTASNGTKPQFLSFPAKNNKQSFKSDTACWIQYKYPESFTCRSVRIHIGGGNNYQAQRLILQSSGDGENFTTIKRLQPPRSGWQDYDEDYTSSVPPTKAKYFRFVYDKAGTEPGSEDLDAAKWKPSLKVAGIYLSDEPVINQFETKNGSVWRVAENTTTTEVPTSLAVPLKQIVNLSPKMDKDGNLNWTAPPGNWIIVRIGHTSTGHTNATGGAGAGLECDKFNAAAVKLQFDNWFAKAFSNTDPALAREVLKVFHVDSWECGSQNWSDHFSAEFKRRRGYDLLPYLLVMTGVPVTDAATSEKVLHDVRQTIAELVNDIFYVTLKNLAHEKGCIFSAESVAPTMVSDGLLHYKNVDLPMGEFWLNSPTHDKPNDMLDAINGAHIYGKRIIGAESFTSVRMNWGEHPGNLKATGDRNFALGINKMALHVFTHNPWMDKKPGMTLDGVGLYFQRDQTWFKQSKAWIDYLTRCQALLQLGKPVVDIAVFTGEEVPRRSVLPNRLVSTLPGIFGKEKVAAEKKRMDNAGQPLRQIPDGVTHSANMADPEDWVDPLKGYAYDSFNPDALMMMSVQNGRVTLPGGASYKILVFPAAMLMNPANRISDRSVKKIMQLVNAGATVLIDPACIKWFAANGLRLNFKKQGDIKISGLGAGKFGLLPYIAEDFKPLLLEKDLAITNAEPGSMAYTHRQYQNADIYFIANQLNQPQTVSLSFRVKDKMPEIWNTVDTGKMYEAYNWKTVNGRTTVIERLEANQSLFIVFRKPAGSNARKTKAHVRGFEQVKQPWTIRFDTAYGGPRAPAIFTTLTSWTEQADTAIKYYSGTAVYENSFVENDKERISRLLLTIDSIYNIATVKINGINCGTVWTKPYELDITRAVKNGENKIEIEVTNTWHNRLIGDNAQPPGKRITFTTAPFRLKDKQLLPAGLMGKVAIEALYK